MEYLELNEKANKVILFYNPYSGKGTFKNNLDYIVERFQEHGLQIIPIRAANGDRLDVFFDTVINQETYKDEYRQIIVAGGDGTINICVTRMKKHNIDLPIAIFPIGTANDFAYNFGISNSVSEMIDIALGDRITRADVGIANGKYFVNVTALGPIVDASQKTDPVLKETIGVLAYYINGVAEIPTLKPTHTKITFKDEIIEEDILFMIVMNGQSAGGFRNLSKKSQINDGLLDVIIFKKMPLIELPNIFFRILAGNHLDSKHIIYKTVDYMLIEADENLATDMDGEKGERLPITFGVEECGMRVFAKT